MKNSNMHAILSDIHRLLSQYSPDDFIAASRYPGVSGIVRSILLALAQEAGPSRHESIGKPPRKDNSRENLDNKRRHPVHQPPSRNGIFDAILKSPRFATPRAILEYASAHGLTVRTKPKDGKERLARRLATAIESAPESVRAAIFAELNREKGSQTQGWIDVIKSSRT